MLTISSLALKDLPLPDTPSRKLFFYLNKYSKVGKITYNSFVFAAYTIFFFNILPRISFNCLIPNDIFLSSRSKVRMTASTSSPTFMKS